MSLAVKLQPHWPVADWIAPVTNIGLGVFFLYPFIGVGVEIVDQSRVSGQLRRQAAKLLKLRQVRARTWLRPRIYQIKYRDMNGWEHIAQCKVSALRGIHYCDDEVLGQP